MEYFNESLKIAEELGMKQFKAFSLLNLGELNYEKVLKNLANQLKIYNLSRRETLYLSISQKMY